MMACHSLSILKREGDGWVVIRQSHRAEQTHRYRANTMTNYTSTKSTKVGRRSPRRVISDKAAAKRIAAKPKLLSGGNLQINTTPKMIRFSATLFRPAATADSRNSSTAVSGDWTFLTLPKQASAKLPSRGQTTVEGTLNGSAFRATLEPDGQGGHWLKVDRKMREAAGAETGDIVTLQVAPVTTGKEPEPKIPADLGKALAGAPSGARKVWSDITPVARRDWVHWIVSARQAETRARRIRTACSMLAAGKRRPCCFDRSGMYGKNLSGPVAAAAR
jgi:hypothetical protein